jgi:hypothetical protein
MLQVGATGINQQNQCFYLRDHSTSIATDDIASVSGVKSSPIDGMRKNRKTKIALSVLNLVWLPQFPLSCSYRAALSNAAPVIYFSGALRRHLIEPTLVNLEGRCVKSSESIILKN